VIEEAQMFLPETTLVSPRITQLSEAVDDGDLDAVDLFWKEVASSGAPLMEPMDEDDDHTLVTFVWRDPGDTENALVVLYSAPNQGDLTPFTMDHIPGTDLWYKSYVLPSELRTTYLLSVNDPLETYDTYEEILGRLSSYRPDPLNPVEFPIFGNDQNKYVVSVLELPKAPRQAWNLARKGVAKGRRRMEELDSEILGTRHHVSVRTPPGYDPGGDPCDVFLLFDGWAYYNYAAVTTVMDNLHHVGRIRPTVLVMHSNLDQSVRAKELPCHRPFHDFLVEELMPWVDGNYNVTPDPARTVVGGSCFGGLAAAYVALESPDRFGNVISQSGSFWWPGPGVPGMAPEWLTEQYRERPIVPVRLSLEIGSLEGAIAEFDPMMAHRDFRDVLVDKGYDVDYVEYTGGHDLICWRGSLVDRLLALVRADQPKERVG
jgi:enterochelin esterase family protein